MFRNKAGRKETKGNSVMATWLGAGNRGEEDGRVGKRLDALSHEREARLPRNGFFKLFG